MSPIIMADELLTQLIFARMVLMLRKYPSKYKTTKQSVSKEIFNDNKLHQNWL